MKDKLVIDLEKIIFFLSIFLLFVIQIFISDFLFFVYIVFVLCFFFIFKQIIKCNN